MRTLIGRTALVAFLMGVAAGCSASPEPSAARTFTVTVSVPIADRPTIEAAEDVFAMRLRALGIDNVSVSTGETMKFTITLPVAFDQRLIDAIFHHPGVVAFLTWPADQHGPQAGDVVPDTIPRLFDAATEIVSATAIHDSAGQRALDLKLGPAAADAFGTYTTNHVGGFIPVALDAKVVWAPMISGPIVGGDLLMTFADSELLPLPLEAIAAMMVSGPLPPGWGH